MKRGGAGVGGGGGGGDPGAYAAVLKTKLDLYCAAVAKSMVNLVPFFFNPKIASLFLFDSLRRSSILRPFGSS